MRFQDAFDCIDLSDNEIKKLENFPRLNRLRMLLLNNNYVTRFQDDLADSITNLEYLILTGNKVSQLGEIDRLVCLQKLDILFMNFYHHFWLSLKCVKP
jgi:U2 small nuclear ribonucleoprotein A'